LVSPTLHLKSANVVNPTPPLTSAKVVALVPSSVNTVYHVINMVTSLVEPIDKVVDLIPYSIDPAIPLESVVGEISIFDTLVQWELTD
jgi:hypothetical protein